MTGFYSCHKTDRKFEEFLMRPQFFSAQKYTDLIVHRKNVSYNLRGDYILSLPKPKSTTYGLNSARYIGPKLWNSIPNMFRNIKNFKSFKRSMH